jgi:MoaA/NifB/PqqE/SkfB family radical SAM enzyme/SAM-dependent methyltransferase
MMDKIEILSVELVDEYKNLADMVYDLSNKLGIMLGWHYILDIVWIVINIKDLPKGSIVLDAGAGNGLLQCVLAGLGYKVISADFSPRTPPGGIRENWNTIEVDDGDNFDNDYIRQLMKTFPAAYNRNLNGNKNIGMDSDAFQNLVQCTDRVIVYYRTDFTKMKLIKDRSVDCVVSLSALEHNSPASIKDAFREFKRVLKPGHKMLITMSATDKKDWFHEESKGWCFTEESLAGFFDLCNFQSNYYRYHELFSKLETGKGLRENLAPVYYKSGDNGMPWGKWNPKYQPVGILKHNHEALSKTGIVKKCNKLYDQFTSDTRYLHQIFLDVNNSCNLDCVMCSRDNSREKAKNMTADDFRTIADKCFRYAMNLQISCAWEASISKHTPEILALLPRYNIPNTSMLTNGNYMTDDLLKAIFDSGLNKLIFSLEETDPLIYSKIRKKGDFNKVVKHIDTVKSYKKRRGLTLPQLCINMTIMKSNIHEMPEFVKFASKLGIEVITGRHLILLEDCDTGNEILYNDRERTNEIIIKAGRMAQESNVVFNVPLINREIEKKTVCARPWDSLYISSNGDASCCPRISRIRSFGNLLNSSFEDVFYTNAAIDSLRISFLNGCVDNEICKWCAEGLEQRKTINQQF